jgi:ATP-dependent DNA helicase RecG
MPTYPEIVVRELIANALIHRDLSQASLMMNISLRVDPAQLLIANPGGLFGLHVDSLGNTPSSLRNARLAETLRFVTDRFGRRVVERLGSGIPMVRDSLKLAGMRPPLFHDQGVRFTARVLAGHVQPTTPPSSGLPPQVPVSPPGQLPLTTRERDILNALPQTDRTIKNIAEITGFPSRLVRRTIAHLETLGYLAKEPVDGRTNRYYLRPPTEQASAA